MMRLETLPTLNASLNAVSAVLLISGYCAIRKKNIPVHVLCMSSACMATLCFLTGYIIYHVKIGATHFQGTGWVRSAYFTILISHMILAVLLVPMVGLTVAPLFRKQFEKHRNIARFTFPIWFYVSVTGVLIYVLLYRYYPFAQSGV